MDQPQIDTRRPDNRRIAASRPDKEALGFRPLYRQVRDVLVKRIVDDVWQPGELRNNA
jgi:hypothetical protein